MRRITVEVLDDFHYRVVENGRHSGELAWDEMLGQIAAMTIPKNKATPKGIYALRTDSEWTEVMDRQKEIARKASILSGDDK